MTKRDYDGLARSHLINLALNECEDVLEYVLDNGTKHCAKELADICRRLRAWKEKGG